MKISYIIYLTSDDSNKINNVIAKLKEGTWVDIEIILIYDKKDGTVDYDPQYSDIVKVITPEVEPLKRFESYNMGVNAVTGDYFRFIDLDDDLTFDTIISEGVLTAMQGFDVLHLYGANKALNPYVTFDDLLNGLINFDRCIFRSSIRDIMGYMFEGYYGELAKPKFLLTAYLFGCTFVEIPYDNIISNIEEFSREQYESLANIYQRKNSPENEMTFIIAFRDENHEIERTVASMRYMCSHSNITLIDDFSDDNFDYKTIADRYGCTYRRLGNNLGSAGAKHFGGITNDTKYFCFFDGHQRIYHKDLDLTFIKHLEEKPNAIFAARSVYIDKKKGYYINESDYKGAPGHKGLSYCCYITDIKGREWDPKWCDKIIDKDDRNKTRVMCVLGAVYAMRTEWFRNIRGMEGLTIYGLEETCISVKTWMLGGECFVLKNIGVGHLYRSKNASPIDPNCIDANRIFLTHMFLDDENTIKKYDDNLKAYIGEDRFKKAMVYFERKRKLSETLNRWLHKYKVRDLKTVFAQINDKVKS